MSPIQFWLRRNGNWANTLPAGEITSLCLSTCEVLAFRRTYGRHCVLSHLGKPGAMASLLSNWEKSVVDYRTLSSGDWIGRATYGLCRRTTFKSAFTQTGAKGGRSRLSPELYLSCTER